MAEHRLLTGDSLHEPKGVATASAGQVYEANGLGSGVWKSRLDGVNNLNKFHLTGVIPDISTASSSFLLVVPQAGTLSKFSGVLSGAITTANATLTIYKNGIAQAPTVSVAFTGSGAGVKTIAAIGPTIAFLEGDTIEVRSDGASDTSATMGVSLSFTATA